MLAEENRSAELLDSLSHNLGIDGFRCVVKRYQGQSGGEITVSSSGNLLIGKYIIEKRGKHWVWYRRRVHKPTRDQKLLLGGPSAAVCVWARKNNVRAVSFDKKGAEIRPLAEVQ